MIKTLQDNDITYDYIITPLPLFCVKTNQSDNHHVGLACYTYFPKAVHNDKEPQVEGSSMFFTSKYTKSDWVNQQFS